MKGNRWSRLIGVGIVAVLAGCSSQDFGSRVVDEEDAAPMPAQGTAADEAALRADQLARALSVWDTQRGNQDIDYQLGPDDVLDVSVMALEKPDEFTTLSCPVSREGTIELPLVGNVPVAGMNASQAATHIADAYRATYLRNPRVTVKITDYRSQPVVVTGAVTAPGVYYLRQNKTTVLELLSLTQGLGATAGESLLIVRRNATGSATTTNATPDASANPDLDATLPADALADDDAPAEPQATAAPADVEAMAAAESELDAQSPPPPASPTPSATPPLASAADYVKADSSAPDMIEVDLTRLLGEGDMRLNATIYGGDFVTVPPAITEYIYVMGYVNSPGDFPLKRGQSLSALKAVAMARGLSPSARASNSFLIMREEGRRKVIPVNLARIARGADAPVFMHAGDTLVVGSSTIAKLGEFVKPSVSAGASVSPVP